MCKDLEGAKFMVFNKQVEELRYEQVMNQINLKRSGWFPKETNAFELYVLAGREWSEIDLSKFTCKQDYENGISRAWEDMPRELDEYFRSLPEFNAEIYYQITGKETPVIEDDITEEAIKILKEKGYKIVKEALGGGK